MKKLIRKDIVYPEESYQIIGVLFDVYNELGPGHHEKYYQRATAKEFSIRHIQFQEQVYAPLRYKNEIVGKQYFDFLIAGKIILEIKKGNRFSKKHIDQVMGYLKSSNLRLAILANFGKEDVTFRRLVNFT